MMEQPSKIEQARQMREAGGMSYGKIAKALGVAKSTVMRWESNGWVLKPMGGKPGNQNAKGHGPPKGSKNALKSGLYEDISYDAMTEEEKELYKQVDTDPAAVLQRNLKALAVRKLRMLKLRENIEKEIEEEEMRVLEETGGGLPEPRKVREKATKRQALLDKKIMLDDAITRVEDLERRNAEALYRMQRDRKQEERAEAGRKGIVFEFKRSK